MYSFASDVTVVGGGLAGLAAALELIERKKRVLLLEKSGPDRLGGLARESFGGICLVNTPEQRRLGICDRPSLALQDWLNFAEFENEDWPRQWAEQYVCRSIPEIYEWLQRLKVTFLPIVNWPERGLFVPGNSVPRWHIVWGTGQYLIQQLLSYIGNHRNRDLLEIRYNCDVQSLEVSNGEVTGCSGKIFLDDQRPDVEFRSSSEAVLLAAGGICGNLNLVRSHWPSSWGNPPKQMLNGSHENANGTVHDMAARAGASITHLDLQFHYAAGIAHPSPRRPDHGLSLVPPRSALWVNAIGERIGPVPLVGGFDTRALVEAICGEPGQYSWQILNWQIAIHELAVSGSEYMTDFRDRKKLRMLKHLLFGNRKLVRRLLSESNDFVQAQSLPELVNNMNQLNTEYKVDAEILRKSIERYDENLKRKECYRNDDQIRRISAVRAYRGDRLRTAKFIPILSSSARPLIAIRERIISRKSLGGIRTNLQSQVLNDQDTVISGLYAAGEMAGFGGGGIHGKRSLEGTFLGSCILTGRAAGKSIAGELL